MARALPTRRRRRIRSQRKLQAVGAPPAGAKVIGVWTSNLNGSLMPTRNRSRSIRRKLPDGSYMQYPSGNATPDQTFETVYETKLSAHKGPSRKTRYIGDSASRPLARKRGWPRAMVPPEGSHTVATPSASACSQIGTGTVRPAKSAPNGNQEDAARMPRRGDHSTTSR